MERVTQHPFPDTAYPPRPNCGLSQVCILGYAYAITSLASTGMPLKCPVIYPGPLTRVSHITLFSERFRQDSHLRPPPTDFRGRSSILSPLSIPAG